MPMLEIHFLKPASKTTANDFKSYLFHNASHYDISIQNEDISKDEDTTILYFEISDFDYGEGFFESLEFAYNNSPAKHKSNIYTKVFHDSVGEEEFFAMPKEKVLKFDSLEDIELYKKAKNRIVRTEVSKYLAKHSVDKYAIIRVRIERKKHETLIKKALESVLKAPSLEEKNSIFSATLDEVVEAQETYYDEFSGWREAMEYQKGKVGQINFLESLVEYHVEKKHLTMLLLDTPYERKAYIPFIWGLFGLFGEKTEIKIWSRTPEQTRILWHYEDNVMGPTKDRAFDVDDWSYDNYKSIECHYYD